MTTLAPPAAPSLAHVLMPPMALLSLFLFILAGSLWLEPAATVLEPTRILLSPRLTHPFGTDALGRDLFARTVCGLALSLRVGLLAALASTLISLALALLAVSLGRLVDGAIAYLIEMTMGLPHYLLLVIISMALGGSVNAVIIAVALSHWPRLARILRAEFSQVLASDYVAAARAFGKDWRFIARRHLLPHALPQAVVGLLLLFPHAILHEAGLTFLGFGFEPSRPAVGVLLSESLRHLSAGHWWLAFFPGAALVLTVVAFDRMADRVHALVTPDRMDG